MRGGGKHNRAHTERSWWDTVEGGEASRTRVRPTEEIIQHGRSAQYSCLTAGMKNQPIKQLAFLILRTHTHTTPSCCNGNTLPTPHSLYLNKYRSPCAYHFAQSLYILPSLKEEEKEKNFNIIITNEHQTTLASWPTLPMMPPASCCLTKILSVAGGTEGPSSGPSKRPRF